MVSAGGGVAKIGRGQTKKKEKLNDSCGFIVLQTPSVKVHKKWKKRTKPIFSHHGQTHIYILSHTFAFSADENVLGRWIFTAWYKVTVTYTESYKLELTAFCSEQREKKEAVNYLLSGYWQHFAQSKEKKKKLSITYFPV